jgi:hypothetical protein
MTLLTIEKQTKVMSTSKIPLLKLIWRAKTIIWIANKLEVRCFWRLGVGLAVGMAQKSLSGWLELFICNKKYSAAYSGLMYLQQEIHVQRRIQWSDVFVPPRTESSCSLWEHIWRNLALQIPTNTEISRIISFSQGCQFTGGGGGGYKLIRMKVAP